MGQVAQGLWQGFTFVLVLGVLGFPFFVWRRRPAYYWRCSDCGNRNPLDKRECERCEHRVLDADMPRYIQADWTGPDVAALYLTAALLGGAAGTLLLVGGGRRPRDNTTEQVLLFLEQPDVLWTLSLMIGSVLTVLTVWMLATRFRWTLAALGLRREGLGMHALLGVGAGVAVAVFGGAVNSIAQVAPGLTSDAAGLLELFPVQIADPLWVLILPATLVVAPLSGELFFRGMVYRMFRARWRMPASVLVTALLFAMGSGVVAPFAALVALGAANGVMFERTRSLAPGVVACSTHGALVVGWAVAKSMWAAA